jgi:leucine efflux protein
MLGVINLPTYIVGTVLIILLPGPNSMFVLSTAARRGVPAGYAAACGVFIGDGVIMALSAAGVASLLRAEPILFDIVKYAGAGYLCWIGSGLIRGAWRRRADHPAQPTVTVEAGTVEAGTGSGAAGVARGRRAARPVPEERSPFRRALGVSLLNPKAILFFVSFFIQFVDKTYPYPALSFLLLGTIAEIISCVYLTTLIFGGSYLATQFRQRRKLARGLTTGVAAIFIGFAVKLATASLT